MPNKITNICFIDLTQETEREKEVLFNNYSLLINNSNTNEEKTISKNNYVCN